MSNNKSIERFPIHCAILGQSERLLRWLVDVQCCPIHLTSTANKGKYEEDALPTLQTSKGRSVMDITMEMKNVGILKYLVKEKGVSVHEVKDLKLVLGALESIIKAFPEEVVSPADEKEISKVHNTKKKIKSPAKAASKSRGNKPASAKPLEMQHPYSVVPYSTKEKTRVPQDIQSTRNAGLYGNIGRYDSDEDNMNEHDATAADSDDDCSVCTTVNELVSDVTFWMLSTFLFLPE